MFCLLTLPFRLFFGLLFGLLFLPFTILLLPFILLRIILKAAFALIMVPFALADGVHRHRVRRAGGVVRAPDLPSVPFIVIGVLRVRLLTRSSPAASAVRG